MDELLDKKQACQALGGLGFTKFYELLKTGELTAVKIGNRTFCKSSEIQRYLSELSAYKPRISQRQGELDL